MDAATLHCPDCGAPAGPDAPECGYCHARLAKASCPRCFATAFAGMRHCPSCGDALDRREAPDDGAAPACPRCDGSLRPLQVGPTRLRECDGCGGVWVDNRTLLSIFHDRERQAPIVSAPPWPGGASGGSAPGLRVGYVRCPECQALMSRVNFARVSGVVVDVCREHGTWFEAGELRRVVEFIDRGGIFRGVTRAAMDAFDLYLRGDASAADRDPWSALFDHFTPRGAE